jgi:dienelactone hydrolase
MAPFLAHYGFDAFVHDKRGTGESEGEFYKTTYDDYINDARNCAIFLSKHERIDPGLVGVMGASEGGRIAVVAADRYPVFTFVISQAGTMVGTIYDRLYAQLNAMVDSGVITDPIAQIVKPLWQKSFEAWASHFPVKHAVIDNEIEEQRKD